MGCPGIGSAPCDFPEIGKVLAKRRCEVNELSEQELRELLTQSKKKAQLRNNYVDPDLDNRLVDI